MSNSVIIRPSNNPPEREVRTLMLYPEDRGFIKEALSDAKDILVITKDFTIESGPSAAKTSGRLVVITARVAKDTFLLISGLAIGFVSKRRGMSVVLSEWKKSISRINLKDVCYCGKLALKIPFMLLGKMKYSLDVIKMAKSLSNSSLELVIPRNHIGVEDRPRSSWQAMKETLYQEAENENKLLGDTKIKRIITLSGILSGIAIAPICLGVGLYATIPFASFLYFSFFAITGGIIEILFTESASLIGCVGNPIANLGHSINYLFYYSSYCATTVSTLIACVIFGAYMGGMFARRWAENHGDRVISEDIAFRKGAVIGAGGTVVASLVSTVANKIISPIVYTIFYPAIKAYRIYRQITIINGIKLVWKVSYSSLKFLLGSGTYGAYKILSWLGVVAKNRSANLLAEVSYLSSKSVTNLTSIFNC